MTRPFPLRTLRAAWPTTVVTLEGPIETPFIKMSSSVTISSSPPLVRTSVSALVYTQLSDVEDETNGFVTYDRQVLKVDKDKIKATLNELYAAIKE